MIACFSVLKSVKSGAGWLIEMDMFKGVLVFKNWVQISGLEQIFLKKV